MNPNNQPTRVLVVADESAAWKVAGLRQLDRVLLALNDYARRAGEPLRVRISGNHPAAHLQDRQFPHLLFVDEIDQNAAIVLSTRVVLDPDSVDQLIRQSDANGIEAGYLHDRSDIAACEKWLLHRTRKSQDGVIARAINRPLSRALSRFLLQFPLSPNHWTVLLTAIPIAGAIFLMRGNYLGFAVGAILFQLHSALDGCDGEMARVKYLESETGRKLDEVCDRFATLLYTVCIGIGLSRQSDINEATQWFYFWEGVIVATLIGVSDTLLTRIPSQMLTARSDTLDRYFKEHRQRFNHGDQLKLWVIKHSGMLFAGHRATSLFGEATKRDVFNFGFMLLALLGWPNLILHILAVSACLIAILTLKNLLAPPVAAKSARQETNAISR